MKKVIVFDNQNCCNFCNFANFVTYSCMAAKREFSNGLRIQLDKGDKVTPLWCPAKELPEYKMQWEDNSYEAGWNDLLDLIGGNRR